MKQGLPQGGGVDVRQHLLVSWGGGGTGGRPRGVGARQSGPVVTVYHALVELVVVRVVRRDDRPVLRTDQGRMGRLRHRAPGPRSATPKLNATCLTVLGNKSVLCLVDTAGGILFTLDQEGGRTNPTLS